MVYGPHDHVYSWEQVLCLLHKVGSRRGMLRSRRDRLAGRCPADIGLKKIQHGRSSEIVGRLYGGEGWNYGWDEGGTMVGNYGWGGWKIHCGVGWNYGRASSCTSKRCVCVCADPWTTCWSSRVTRPCGPVFVMVSQVLY